MKLPYFISFYSAILQYCCLREAVKHAPTVAEEEWMSVAGKPYVSEAGYYFKTLAAQEIGKCTKR